ncbi:MAG: outer membrane protein assembly factor BamC [Pseudomonadaceae bacterium]|nr:outer membrane protein assembly factor BamC [Pseudomonadaceae bacterium]
MKLGKLPLPLILLVGLMAGCSSSEYQDRNTDYYQAHEASNDLPRSYPNQDAMPIAKAERSFNEPKLKAPRPEPLRVMDEAEGLVTERVDEQGAWLLVLRSPSEVWTSLRAFAESRDVALVSASPRRGELALAADPASRLPAQRIDLRQGVRRGTSEIRLRSYEVGQDLPWSDYDRSRVKSLAEFLTASLSQAGHSVSLQAQSLQDNQLVRLVDRDERQVLVMQLEYERAWAELVNLFEDKFTDDWQKLEDLNRSEGRFYIRYVPKDARPSGFFARLFSRGPKPEEHHYQLHLTEYGQELDLVLESLTNQAAPAAIELELLTWLERQLR